MTATTWRAARFAAEAEHKRAQTAADVCARVLIDAICDNGTLPKGAIDHYRELRAVERAVYQRMRDVQRAGVA